MKEFLSQKGVAFTEKDVSIDRSAAAEMISKSGQTGVPVITVDREVVVGFNRPQLEQLLARGSSSGPRPRLGMQIADSGTAGTVSKKSGAYVGSVASGGSAEQAGVRQGDVITQINSTPVNTARDLQEALATMQVGTKAVLKVARGEQTLGIELVLRA